MLKISDRSKVPRELYDYTVRETNTTLKAHSFGLCVAKVRAHCVANQIALPENLADVVEEDWCERHPHHCEDPNAYVPKDKAASDLFTQVIAAAAIPAADALAIIAKAFGIDCNGCKKRHRLVKEMKKRGFLETVRLIKQSFHA